MARHSRNLVHGCSSASVDTDPEMSFVRLVLYPSTQLPGSSEMEEFDFG